jgi:hypothetical protein
MPNVKSGQSRIWLKARSAYRAVLSLLPSSLAIRLHYFRMTGRVALRLRKPVTFSEKVQHRKLYERDPRMPPLVDKIEVKKFVETRLGPEWIIPTLHAGRALPPRDKRNWPFPYVIKPSHRSGKILFVRGPEDVDWPGMEEQCAEWTATHYGKHAGEWAYGQIEPRILVEEYIGGQSAPPDYKFFCFNGRVEFIQVDTDRETEHKRVFFDREWRRQDFTLEYPIEHRDLCAPDSLASMLAGAETLAFGWSFVRVDLYEFEGKPKFGEMTFYPGSGSEQFNPPEWDRAFGDLWRI